MCGSFRKKKKKKNKEPILGYRTCFKFSLFFFTSEAVHVFNVVDGGAGGRDRRGGKLGRRKEVQFFFFQRRGEAGFSGRHKLANKSRWEPDGILMGYDKCRNYGAEEMVAISG